MGVNWAELTKPFDLSDLDIRVLRKDKGQNPSWVMWSVFAKGDVVVDRLNTVLGPDGWSFRLVSDRVDDCANGEKFITVFCELEIGGAVRADTSSDALVATTGWGDDKTLTNNEFASKSAMTSALVKCAARFGIGRELRDYEFLYTKGERDAHKQFAPPDFHKLLAKANAAAFAAWRERNKLPAEEKPAPEKPKQEAATDAKKQPAENKAGLDLAAVRAMAKKKYGDWHKGDEAIKDIIKHLAIGKSMRDLNDGELAVIAKELS